MARTVLWRRRLLRSDWITKAGPPPLRLPRRRGHFGETSRVSTASRSAGPPARNTPSTPIVVGHCGSVPQRGALCYIPLRGSSSHPVRITLHKHIVADPAVCHGKPTFKGTRVMVWQVLEMLAGGATYVEMRKAFPTLTAAHVRAALEYASSITR